MTKLPGVAWSGWIRYYDHPVYWMTGQLVLFGFSLTKG